MDGLLKQVKPYESKTQTKYKGTVYKCVWQVEKDGVIEDNWSLQAFPMMRNFRHWSDIINTKLKNPHKVIIVSNLKQLGSRPRTLDADYGPNEDKPEILGVIDDTIKTPKPPKQPKQSRDTQFNDLFVWKGQQ